MILATVKFHLGNTIMTAHLSALGWSVVHGHSILDSALDLISPLSDFGPADGDPVAACAARIAATFKGTVSYVRELPAQPTDAVN
jgi:hypothetical protein